MTDGQTRYIDTGPPEPRFDEEPDDGLAARILRAHERDYGTRMSSHPPNEMVASFNEDNAKRQGLLDRAVATLEGTNDRVEKAEADLHKTRQVLSGDGITANVCPKCGGHEFWFSRCVNEDGEPEGYFCEKCGASESEAWSMLAVVTRERDELRKERDELQKMHEACEEFANVDTDKLVIERDDLQRRLRLLQEIMVDDWVSTALDSRVRLAAKMYDTLQWVFGKMAALPLLRVPIGNSVLVQVNEVRNRIEETLEGCKEVAG